MTNKPELLRRVINKFLDEQEAFYNNIEYVEDFILEMKDCDHMVLTFNNEIQFKEIVNAFIKRGINYNQMNILLIYRKEEQKYLRTLDKIPNMTALGIEKTHFEELEGMIDDEESEEGLSVEAVELQREEKEENG